MGLKKFLKKAGKAAKKAGKDYMSVAQVAKISKGKVKLSKKAKNLAKKLGGKKLAAGIEGALGAGLGYATGGLSAAGSGVLGGFGPMKQTFDDIDAIVHQGEDIWKQGKDIWGGFGSKGSGGGGGGPGGFEGEAAAPAPASSSMLPYLLIGGAALALVLVMRK